MIRSGFNLRHRCSQRVFEPSGRNHNSEVCNNTGQFIAPSFPSPLVLKIPKRRKTSEHVTRIDIRISTIMIHVIRDILLSEMKSDSTSARSRNTRHLSLSTWIRGLISRYSRMARYRGCNVGSDSHMRLGTSSTFDAVVDQYKAQSQSTCCTHIG